jgi:hypothetical protein
VALRYVRTTIHLARSVAQQPRPANCSLGPCYIIIPAVIECGWPLVRFHRSSRSNKRSLSKLYHVKSCVRRLQRHMVHLFLAWVACYEYLLIADDSQYGGGHDNLL